MQIDPIIPGWWDGFQMIYRHGQAIYEIRVENREHRERGVALVELDGQRLKDGVIRLNREWSSIGRGPHGKSIMKTFTYYYRILTISMRITGSHFGPARRDDAPGKKHLGRGLPGLDPALQRRNWPSWNRPGYSRWRYSNSVFASSPDCLRASRAVAAKPPRKHLASFANHAPSSSRSAVFPPAGTSAPS